MAFTSAILGRATLGDVAVTYGTWTTDTTGGDIDTGLHRCNHIELTPIAAATEQTACTDTLPVLGSAVTILVTSGVDGTFIAYGDTWA